MVLASQGYPKKYETGYPITIPADLDAEVYVAGAKLDDGGFEDLRRPCPGRHCHRRHPERGH